jgi:protein O-mannosyl-transferase
LTKSGVPLWIVPLLGIAVYANSIGGSFHYDDFHSIVENHSIRDWANGLWFFVDPGHFSADAQKAMYRPLLLLSYALNYSVGDYAVLGYHVFNIIIHAVASFLVARVYERIVGDTRAALLCGLLFTVHPLTSEPVNYISSRSESLMACFYLSTLYFYTGDRQRARWLSPFFFVCALLTKSVALTVPFVLLAYDRWRRNVDWRRLLPYLMIWSGYLVLLVANRFLGDSLRAPVRSWDVQIWTQCKAPAYYLKLLFFPWGLNVEHQFFESRSLAEPAALTGALLLLSLLYIAWLARRQWSGFALMFSIFVLLPSTLMPLNMLVNERRLYLVLAAFCWLLAMLWQRLPRSLFYSWLGLLALLSIERNFIWESEMSLWADAAAKAPKMYRAQSNWGKVLQENGRWQEALVAYERAIEIDGRFGDAYNNMATIYHLQGDWASAIGWYEKALIRYPDYEEIYQNIADAHAQSGDLNAAVIAYQRALQIDPERGETWSNYGQVLYTAKRLDEAENAFLRAVALVPELAEPYNNLGNIYADRREYDRAVAMYGKALELAPRARGQVVVNLATTLAALGDSERARSLIEEALATEPERAEWHYRLGRLERTLGQRAEAVAAFAKAVELDEQHVLALVNWGEVLLEMGSVAEASECFARATRIDENYGRGWYGLGRALRLGESRDEARYALARFLKLWPNKDARAAQAMEWLSELENDL